MTDRLMGGELGRRPSWTSQGLSAIWFHPEGREALVVSLTQVHVPRSIPFSAAIAYYQIASRQEAEEASKANPKAKSAAE